MNFVQTLRNPKLKVWKKSVDIIKGIEEKQSVIKVAQIAARQPVSSSKISEIALIIDTGGVYQGEAPNHL